MPTTEPASATAHARLNLGCGEDYREDAWNVDVAPAVDPDEVIDLQATPWPWPDAAFETVIARHVLEHLDPVPFDELARILKPGGTLRLTYPIGHTRFEDPTHEQFWNWHTAAAIAGERQHAHEYTDAFDLVERRLQWAAGNRLARLFVQLKLAVDGPGAWLSQVPGLHGEVTAVYTRR